MRIWKTQFGFRKGCGTREAIPVMRSLYERRLEFMKSCLFALLILKKLSDKVKWQRRIPKVKSTKEIVYIDYKLLNVDMTQTAKYHLK